MELLKTVQQIPFLLDPIGSILVIFYIFICVFPHVQSQIETDSTDSSHRESLMMIMMIKYHIYNKHITRKHSKEVEDRYLLSSKK